MPERFNQFFGILSEHTTGKTIVYVLPYMPAELNAHDAWRFAFAQRFRKRVSVLGVPVTGRRRCGKSRA